MSYFFATKYCKVFAFICSWLHVVYRSSNIVLGIVIDKVVKIMCNLVRLCDLTFLSYLTMLDSTKNSHSMDHSEIIIQHVTSIGSYAWPDSENENFSEHKRLAQTKPSLTHAVNLIKNKREAETWFLLEFCELFIGLCLGESRRVNYEQGDVMKQRNKILRINL